MSEDPEVMAGALWRRSHLAMLQFEVLPHEGRGGAVGRFHEFVHRLVHVRLGIPQQAREHPGLQRGVLGSTAGRRSSLHEQADHTVPFVHGNVGGELVEIREGLEVVAEVRVVVPNVELAGNLRPGPQVIHDERIVRALFVRMRFARTDGADPDANVVTWTDA